MFWVRYFFRVHQIEAEENRRKALLQGKSYLSGVKQGDAKPLKKRLRRMKTISVGRTTRTSLSRRKPQRLPTRWRHRSTRSHLPGRDLRRMACCYHPRTLRVPGRAVRIAMMLFLAMPAVPERLKRKGREMKTGRRRRKKGTRTATGNNVYTVWFVCLGPLIVSFPD